MYARLAVASNALSTAGLPLPTANLVHTTLLEQVNAHGRLVFGNDPEVAALLRAIRSGDGIPQDARTRWTETLTRLLKHGRIKVLHDDHTALADCQALADLRAHWGANADVAIVATEACESLGIPTDIGLVTEPGTSPDVAITSAAISSPALQRLKTLTANAVAASGSPREDFWHQILEPLATDARSATFLDAYLFKSIWDLSHKRHWTRDWRVEQIAWLLEHLDAVMAPGATVHLIGNRHNDYPTATAATTADAIRDHWQPITIGRLKKVTVSLADPGRSERFPHDRHLRLSTGAAIEVSAGFDRLRQDKIWDPDGMKWKYIWNSPALRALQSAEERAVSYARHPQVAVLDR